MPAHDVLIIGAGLAGQRAALAAARDGASVAILSKVHPVRSHSVAAAGGINAAINVADDWRSHAYDTVKGSDFLGDQDAIEVMCSEAPAEVMHLEHIGVTFHRNEQGEMDLRAFGGASMKRTAYVADITGQAMLHVLYEQLMKHHETVERYEEWFSTSLLQDRDGQCCGVIARDVRSGRMEAFAAKSVILACGGAGQVYKPTTNGLIVTGDGIAMAYRAGAPLMDMEMVQYHPTCLVETGILITEGARGEGAHLLNSDGERFMSKAAPNKMELASRDVVSRAEQIEINEGRGVGPGGKGIYLDVTVVPRKRTLEALREIVNLGKDFAGVDITREPITIRPGQHYIMGGVKTDIDGRTPIEGLYAAGEVACVSVHGGNRLGANSLLDTLIFGRRAGEHAAARFGEHGNARHRHERAAGRRHGADRLDHRPAARRQAGVGDQGRAGRADEPSRRRVPRRSRTAGRAGDDRAPARGGRACLDRRSGHRLQPGRARRDRARLHGRLRRGDRDRGDRAQGVPGRAVPHRLPRAQRRAVAQAHRHHAAARVARGRATRRSRSRSGSPRRGSTDGRGQRQAPRAVPAADAPLRPRVRRGALLGRAHDRARAAPLGARGDPAGTRPLRRLDRHPLLVPPGDLRLLRRARQRRARAGLPHPPRRGDARRRATGYRDRADGQHAGDQGPDRRHGRRPLEEDPARHAVADRQAARARARVPGGERGDGRRHPDDGLHPMRRVRVGLPGDGGGPGLHRPGGAGQGIPLRRRPAR